MDESVSPGRFLASRDGGAENPGEERGKSEGGVMRGVVDVLPVAEDATDDADDAEEDLDAIWGTGSHSSTSWFESLRWKGGDSQLPSWLAS